MWNPFRNTITLTPEMVFALLGQKEAELQIARAHIQQAAQIIEGLKAKLAPPQTEG